MEKEGNFKLQEKESKLYRSRGREGKGRRGKENLNGVRGGGGGEGNGKC